MSNLLLLPNETEEDAGDEDTQEQRRIGFELGEWSMMRQLYDDMRRCQLCSFADPGCVRCTARQQGRLLEREDILALIDEFDAPHEMPWQRAIIAKLRDKLSNRKS